MPSTLYNSVKQSVVEYAQTKKKNQRVQERMLFRWKLVTILLAIIFIILVGVFSQYLKSINNLPNVESDSTYLVPLLGSISTEAVVSLVHAKNMINGITLTSKHDGQHFQWNKAQLLYTSNFINSTNLAATIKGKQHLLFLFYDPTNQARFGLYLHKGYVGESNTGGVKTVKDDSGSKYSSMFNLNDGEKTLMYNANCNILAVSDTQISIFQGIVTTIVADQSGLVFDVNKPECYHASSAADAFNKLIEVTGIASQGKPTTVFGVTIEVYRLYLDEEN